MHDSQSVDDSLLLFSPCKVDNEFEEVATQLLKRTQAMLNKYRSLLLEDAMVQYAPSMAACAVQPSLRHRERHRDCTPGV